MIEPHCPEIEAIYVETKNRSMLTGKFDLERLTVGSATRQPFPRALRQPAQNLPPRALCRLRGITFQIGGNLGQTAQ